MGFPRNYQQGVVHAAEEESAAKHGVLPSLLVNRLIKIQAGGERVNLSYERRPYLRQIVDSYPALKKILLTFARQSEKSSTISAIANALSPVLGLTWQYVSATMEQAREFSQWKVDGAIRDSEILSGLYDVSGRRRPYGIRRKESFANSRILVGTAFGDASRIRGNPADALSIDELSLVEQDNIPILQECISHPASMGFEIHSGTPLSTDNTLWVMQEASIQHEWALCCENHTPLHWLIPGPENLYPDGVHCDRCGAALSSENGIWVTTSTPQTARFHSFRVPQIIVPGCDYLDVIKKFLANPIKCLQEAFAISVEQAYEIFSAIFLQSELCDPNFRITPKSWQSICSIYPAYGGIDWAQGGDCSTVLTLGSYAGTNRFHYVAQFRFGGVDPDRDLEEIRNILKLANVHRVVADFGAGYLRNRTLQRELGFPKFMECEYVQQNDRILLDPKSGRLKVSRNSVLDDYVTALRMRPREFRFPCRQDMEEVHWFQDLRAVGVEMDKLGRPIYIRKAGQTDDGFHSSFYCFLAAHLAQPRPDMMAPVLHKVLK